MCRMFDFASQRERAQMYRRIRDFFDQRGYQEVFTPTLSPTLIPEPTIQNFRTEFINPFTGDRDFYLIPSPEIFMKELLAAGSGSIYQISQCFRNSEQLGQVHNPEFTMLEYYTLGFSDSDSIALTRELMDALITPSSPAFLKDDFLILTVNEAMQKWTGTDLDKFQDRGMLIERARELGQSPSDDESWDDVFNRIFINYVEPALPRDRIVVLRDYPAQIDCLARKAEGPYRQRWEMYIAGIEVANCYSEETDSAVTQAYYKKEHRALAGQRQGTGLPIPPSSLRFPTLEIPKSSGVAIGLDRLLMCLTGRKDIRDVLLFPFERLMAEEIVAR